MFINRLEVTMVNVENVVSVYTKLKAEVMNFDNNIKANPQKYYISFRKNRNFAFLKFRKKKLHIIIMLPYETGVNIIKKHKITQLAESMQKFYNGASFQVTLRNKENIDEILEALKEAYNLQS